MLQIPELSEPRLHSIHRVISIFIRVVCIVKRELRRVTTARIMGRQQLAFFRLTTDWLTFRRKRDSRIMKFRLMLRSDSTPSFSRTNRSPLDIDPLNNASRIDSVSIEGASLAPPVHHDTGPEDGAASIVGHCAALAHHDASSGTWVLKGPA